MKINETKMKLQIKRHGSSIKTSANGMKDSKVMIYLKMQPKTLRDPEFRSFKFANMNFKKCKPNQFIILKLIISFNSY